MFNFEMFTQTYGNFKMLRFDANPIKIGYPVTDRVMSNLLMLKTILI